jgi:branched-chain amino acid transport system substrate-binding protein
VAVLYQNHDSGNDYVASLKDWLGPDRAGIIVGAASYEVSEPTIDSQAVTLLSALAIAQWGE